MNKMNNEMEKVEEKKNRVRICTQVSVEVTAAGEGLVLDKTKSPVTQKPTNNVTKQQNTTNETLQQQEPTTVCTPSSSSKAGRIDEMFPEYPMDFTDSEDDAVGTGEGEMASEEENRILNDDDYQSFTSSDSSDADVTVAANPAKGKETNTPLCGTMAKTLSLAGANSTSTPKKGSGECEPTEVCEDGLGSCTTLRNTSPENRSSHGPKPIEGNKVHPSKQNKEGDQDPELKRIENARRAVRRYGKGDTTKLRLRDWKRLSWARKLLAKSEAESETPVEKTRITVSEDRSASSSKAAATSNPKVRPENGPDHRRVDHAGTSNRQKRSRHNDSTPPTMTVTKKHKSAGSEDTPKSIQVAVINEGSSEKRLTNEQWAQVEVKLLECVNEEILACTGFVPTFGPLSTKKGFKVLACCGQPTLNWLRSKVDNMKGLIEGVTLSVALKCDLPTRPKVRINVPGPSIDSITLLRLLRAQNPNLPSADWKVMHMEEPTKTGREVVLMLNYETMGMLPSRDYRLKFGINAVRVRPETVANTTTKTKNYLQHKNDKGAATQSAAQ